MENNKVNMRKTPTESEYQLWVQKMTKYAKKEKSMMEFPKRGDIWTLDFGQGVGSEMRGTRPVVVLSSSLTNEKTNTLLVLPITKHSGTEESERNTDFIFHLPLTPDLLKWGGDKVEGVVKTETIYTKSRGRIGKRIGRLNDEGINKVSELVSRVLHVREPISPDDDMKKMVEKAERRREAKKARLPYKKNEL